MIYTIIDVEYLSNGDPFWIFLWRFRDLRYKILYLILIFLFIFFSFLILVR